MICPNCRLNNAVEARFCANCGTALPAQESGPQAANFGEPTPTGGAAPPSPVTRTPAGAPSTLVPRDLGGLLSATFAFYRANFRVLFGLAAIGSVPLFIADFMPSEVIKATLAVASLFTGLLANAGTTHVVARRHLGRPATVTGAYVAALNSGPSLLVNALAFGAVMVGTAILSILLVGIPLLFFFLVVWFFYTQAVIIEGKGPGVALIRSRDLVRGSWWRVFGIGIVFVLVLAVCTFAAMGPGLLVGLTSKVWGDLLTTWGGVLVSPIGYVGATLVYLDLRVRKEGYTLDALARDMG